MKVHQQSTIHAILCTLLTLLTLLAGCQGSSGVDASGGSRRSEFPLLEEQPSGARGVIEVKSDLESRENPDQWTEIVLAARIGGIEGETWDPDRAAFVVMDSSVVEPEPTHEPTQHDADNCPFCRANRKKLLASTALVEVVDSTGQVPPVHAGKLLGVEEGQAIVLQGQGRIDGLGNLAVRATGVFVPAKGAGL
jgi:hypothetical protein